MQRDRTTFKMHPPHILATDAELLVKGTADRHRDVPEEIRRRIGRWCAAEMARGGYPLRRFYPDMGQQQQQEEGPNRAPGRR